MKIGIITLPSHTNYGWILQAYALQTILQRMGNDVSFIEELPPRINYLRYILRIVKRIIKKILRLNAVPILLEKDLEICRSRPQHFINRYLSIKKVNSFASLSDNDYDAYIVGSDQIWRPKYYSGDIADAFLKFTKEWNVKRLAYAPSFGTSEWEYTKDQETECRKLIQKFNTVLVREDNGVTLCRNHFNIDAYHVVDPTLLLSVNDYIQLFRRTNTPKSKGSLLTYILDETTQKQEIVNRFAKEHGLEPFRVNSPMFDYSKEIEERKQPSLESWLRGFYDAEFIVTDSFHACVFSIIFHKNFIVIANEGRGLSRIQSLLRKLKLEERLVNSSETNAIQNLPHIDFQAVDILLEEWKKYSLLMLEKALNE